MHRCWSHLTRISQILPITLKHSVLHSTMSWMGPGSNKSLPTHLPVKHVCSECGCIRDESFPGNYSLNQHLVLGRVRHWCLPELGHTALPGSGFKRQSWNYPCNYEMELKMMPKNRGSLAPAKPLPHNAVTRDSRTLPAQAVPEHTWRWHNLAHSVHPTGTNPAELLHSQSPGYLHTKLSACEMLLFTSWDTDKLQKTVILHSDPKEFLVEIIPVLLGNVMMWGRFS